MHIIFKTQNYWIVFFLSILFVAMQSSLDLFH